MAAEGAIYPVGVLSTTVNSPLELSSSCPICIGASHRYSFIAHGAPTQMQQHVSYTTARSSSQQVSPHPSVSSCRARTTTPATGGSNPPTMHPPTEQLHSGRGWVGTTLYSRLNAAA